MRVAQHMAAGICLFVFPALLRAADWPQWRFDANRSAATEETCTDNPSQLWHLPLPQPDPAYDHQYRMCADIYTGTYLWKTEMPRTAWIETYYFDTRHYGRATEQHCALARDLFYAVIGDKINAYDTATGKLHAEIDVPTRFHAAVADTQKTQDYRAQGHSGRIRPVPPWSEVRLHDDLLMAVFGKHLAALDRYRGDLRWSRQSTRQTTAYAVGQGTLYGIDYDVSARTGGGEGSHTALLFALDPATGRAAWETTVTYPPTPEHAPMHVNLRPWLRPTVPVVAYNAKHRLVILSRNGNELHVHRADDGSEVWSLTGQTKGDPMRIAPPVVMDDYLLVSQYKDCFGFLLDVRTGKEVGETTGIPQPRTCARVIGNDNLLVYRDAATELYDVNALYHLPQADSFRPRRVTASWHNQAEALFSSGDR